MKFKQGEIVNFDVYGAFAEELFGSNLAHPLNRETVRGVSDRDKIKVATIKSSSRVDGEVLKLLPNLELLITRTVGIDHVDEVACKKQGVELRNIPDYGAFSVAEHVMALLLTLTRKVIFLDREIRSGRFASNGGMGFTLAKKTMGVVGAGRIGIEIIKLARAFRMKVVAFDMYPNPVVAKKYKFTYVKLDELLKMSDVISLNVPLTEKTKHLISSDQIKLMKKGVVLINTSRGAVVDTKALVQMIDRFAYVGLDVLEDEDKFTKDHPLLHFKNVVITPHCAFFTDRSVKEIAKKTKTIISEFKSKPK